MMVAGEASGDLHGSNLVRAIRQTIDSVWFCGIGGQAMNHAGVSIYLDASEISVIGISEVFTKISGILKGLRIARNILKHLNPDLLILIDFPDFNFLVARMAKRYQIPVLYYISPQIWAWRTGRVKQIKKLVNHMAVILPFEANFYQKHNIPVTYVGHPILDTRLGSIELSTNNITSPPVIGLLPGSRYGEVSRHLPIMLQTATILKERIKDVSFLISKASSIDEEFIQAIIKSSLVSSNLAYEIISIGASSVFEKSTLAIAASGTVTLEGAIIGTPMIVIYKVSNVSYHIGKALIRVKHICLANLIAGKAVVPELIQENANPKRISEIALDLLNHPHKMEQLKEEFKIVRQLLGKPGASKRTAELVKNLLITRYWTPKS